MAKRNRSRLPAREHRQRIPPEPLVKRWHWGKHLAFEPLEPRLVLSAWYDPLLIKIDQVGGIDALRTSLPVEGYLDFVGGEERAGWIDVRHPAYFDAPPPYNPPTVLEGPLDVIATDSKLGYDYSENYVSVRNVFVTDSVGVSADPRLEVPDPRTSYPSFKPIQRDYAYANAVFAQLGFSVQTESNVRLDLGAEGPSAKAPFTTTEIESIFAYQGGNIRADGPTVNNYYVTSYEDQGIGGYTLWPAEFLAPAVSIAEKIKVDKKTYKQSIYPEVFAHELAHFLVDDYFFKVEGNLNTEDHSPADLDLLWGSADKLNHDPKGNGGFGNLYENDASRLPGSKIGQIGGQDQFKELLRIDSDPKRAYSRSQAEALYVGDTNSDPMQQRTISDAGDRADFRWVEDSETLERLKDKDGTSLVDHTPGIDSLVWHINSSGIGNSTNSEQDTGDWLTGTTVLPSGGFSGTSFDVVDVLSVIARYSDMDVGQSDHADSPGVNDTNLWSPLESALDYQIEFSANGTDWEAGKLAMIFQGGWAENSHADDFVGRWLSPIEATYVRISRLGDAYHDGTVQIDAMIAGNTSNSIQGTMFREGDNDLDGDVNLNGEVDSQDNRQFGFNVKLVHTTDAQYNREVMTDAQGNYSFIDVTPGDYHLEFSLPTGEASTNQLTTSNPLGSHVDSNGDTATFTVTTSSQHVRNAGTYDLEEIGLSGVDWTNLIRLLAGSAESAIGGTVPVAGAGSVSIGGSGSASVLTLPDIPFLESSLHDIVDLDGLFSTLIDGMVEPMSIAADAAPTGYVLSSDALFVVSTDGINFHDVFVRASQTNDNTSVADLAADLDTALLVAGIGDQLLATVSDDGRLVVETVPNAAVQSLSVLTLAMTSSGGGADTDVAEYGQLDSNIGALNNLTINVTRTQRDENGALLPSVTVPYTIPTIGTTPPGVNDVSFPYTQDNITLQDLADDLNTALLAVGLTSVMAFVDRGANETSATDDRLILAATDATVDKIEVDGASGSRLGFAAGQSVEFTTSMDTNINTAHTEMEFDDERTVAEPNFFSIDTFVQRLVERMHAVSDGPLPPDFDPDHYYDEATETLELNFALSHVFTDRLTLDLFEGIDLGTILGQLEVAALADADVTIRTDLDFRLGLYLGDLKDLNGGFQIDGNTLLSELNNGRGVQLLVGMTVDVDLPSDGQLPDSAPSTPETFLPFSLTLEREGNVFDTVNLELYVNDPNGVNVPVEDRQPYTDDNSSASMLVADLNRLFEQTVYGSGTLADVVVAELYQKIDHTGAVQERKLMLRSVDSTVRKMMISGASDLGFITTTESHWNDLHVFLGDGSDFFVNLDGVDTVGDVMTRIETASGGKVDVTINNDNSGLNVTDVSGGTGLLTILPGEEAVRDVEVEDPPSSTTYVYVTEDSHQSLAGENLGILGNERDIDDDGDGVAEEDNIIQGEPLHGLDSLNRLYIVEQAAGQAADHRHLTITADLVADLDVTGALDEIGLDLHSALDDPLTISIMAEIHLTDPDGSGEIYISEFTDDTLPTILLDTVFDVGGSGTLEVAANVFDEDDRFDLTAMFGETDPTFTLSFAFDTGSNKFAFTPSVEFDALFDQLDDFGVEDFVQVLERLVDEIRNNPDLPFLNQKIPLIDKSIGDALKLADTLLDAADRIISYVDFDEVEDARKDVETAVNNLGLSVEERQELFDQLDVLRRVATKPEPDADEDPDNLDADPDHVAQFQEFLDRLPARLLSAVAQLGKLINRHVRNDTGGYEDLIFAYKLLVRQVPAVNSIEQRLANVIEDALNEALAPPEDSPIEVTVNLGYEDFDGDVSAGNREDRLLAFGIIIESDELVSETYVPSFPTSKEVGPITLALDAELEVVIAGQVSIGLAIDPDETTGERYYLVVNPPDSGDDDLVKTALHLEVGLDGQAEGTVGFGSFEVIDVDGEFTVLEATREVIDSPSTAFVNDQLVLADTPYYFKSDDSFEDDGRFMVVVVEKADGTRDVLSFSDGDYKLLPNGSNPPILEIVHSEIDLSSEASRVTIEYQTSDVPGVRDDDRATDHDAKLDISFLPKLNSLTHKFDFSATTAAVTDLDAGNIHSQVTAGFSAQSIALLTTASVLVQEEGQRWLLTNGLDGYTLWWDSVNSMIKVYDLPNALGVVAFGDLQDDTDVIVDIKGMLTAVLDATLLGNNADNLVTLATSFYHPLDPQLTFDEDALSDLFKLDFNLKTIVTGIDKLLEVLDELVRKKIADELPLASEGMEAEETVFGKLRTKFTVPLLDFLCNTAGALEEVAQYVQQFIYDTLGPVPGGLAILGDRNGGGITVDDVVVVLTEEEFEIQFQLAGRDETIVDFNSGLEGLPLTGEGGVKLGWGYEIDFGVGIARNEGFYFILNNTNDPELSIDIGAGLIVDQSSPEPKPTTLMVDLFGLELSATDILPVDENGNPTGEPGTRVGAELSIDIKDPLNNGDNHVSIEDIIKGPLTDVFSVSAFATAAVNLRLAAGINENLPSVQTDLVVDWSATLDSNQSGNLVFTINPLSITFEHLGINLGDFLSEHIGKVVEDVDKFIEPIKPVVKLLTTEVPGVSQLSIAAGKGPVDFLDLAFIKNPDKGKQARKFVDTVAGIIDVIDGLNQLGPGENLFVELIAEYPVLGAGSGAGEQLVLPGGTASGGLDGPLAYLAGGQVQTSSGAGSGINDVGGVLNGLLQRLHDLGIMIDFIETPNNIVKMLLGQPFDVITWDIPRFELPFTWEKEFAVIPIPKIDLRIGLDAEIFADLSVGYDSHGLVTGNFFDGFYFGDRRDEDGRIYAGEDIDEFGLGLGVRLAALLDLLIVQAGVEGEIRADILANWRDLDDDGKIHLDEIEQIIDQDGIECLFDLHGELRAIVRAVWEFTPTGKTGSKEFINELLFEFIHECPVYELGHVSEGETLPGITSAFNEFNTAGTLVLHAGAFAGMRGPGSTTDVAEAFEIEKLAPGVFAVRALGLESRYSGVERIYFDGGNRDDSLTLINVDVKVAAFGGAGNDVLYGGPEADLLDGGIGDDLIVGRGAGDTIASGAGNDLIYGGLAPTDSSGWGTDAADTIDAGAGDDVVLGQLGGDEIHGGAGDDILYGDSDLIDGPQPSDGDDQIYGDAGNDRIFGFGGVDYIEGGSGSDLLLGDAGDDTVLGGSGADLVSGGIGQDMLDGQSGNDVVLGGLATDSADLETILITMLSFLDTTFPGSGSTWFDFIASSETAGDDGADVMFGGVDNDLMIGDRGPDLMYGGWGDDVILAYRIKDMNDPNSAPYHHIEGGPGNDFICAAEGVDHIYGGTTDINVLGHVGLTHILDTDPGYGSLSGGFDQVSCDEAPTVMIPDPVTISGQKFEDRNGNGVRDAGEPALNGFVIELYDLEGELIDTAETTDIDLNNDGSIDPVTETGVYLFEGLDPGRYVIAEAAVAGYVQTTPTSGYDQVLNAGQSANGLDFGNQGFGEVHGVKWLDLDGDGQRGENEPGVAGIVIYADLDGDGVYDLDEPSTTTMADDPLTMDKDETGMYWLTDLPVGTYAIREVAPAGSIQTNPAASSVYTNNFNGFVGGEWSDATTTTSPATQEVHTGSQTLIEARKYLGGFGNESVSLQLGALPVHSNVRITADLILVGNWDGDGSGAPDEMIWTLRDPLGNSTDQVVFDATFSNPTSSTALQSYPARLSNGLNPAGTGARSIDTLGYSSDSIYRISFTVLHTSDELVLDFEALGLDASGETWGLDNINITIFGEGRSVTVTAGSVVDGVDFGNKLVTSELRGQKWLDAAGNGQRDLPEDVGLDGWEIQLLDTSFNVLRTTVASSADLNSDGTIDPITEQGLYSFADVLPGTYYVAETLVQSYTQTFPGPMPNYYTVTVTGGELVRGLDFGNAPPGEVHGMKWDDLDGDGVHDPGEPGVYGVTIYADLNNNMMLDMGEPFAVTMPRSSEEVAGDGNYDGLVDEADFLVWRSNFGLTGATFSQGDFNHDTVVDGRDYTVWRDNVDARAEVVAGEYHLLNVPAGMIAIREILPPGTVTTYPAAGFHVVDVPQGGIVLDVDFGNMQNDPQDPATIHGRKLLDEGQIGDLNDDVFGVENVTIYVDLNDNGIRDNFNGSLEPFGVTDVGGFYWIMGIPAGVWNVREIVPPGYEQTYPSMPPFHTVDLSPGEEIFDVDFGNALILPGGGSDASGAGDSSGSGADTVSNIGGGYYPSGSTPLPLGYDYRLRDYFFLAQTVQVTTTGGLTGVHLSVQRGGDGNVNDRYLFEVQIRDVSPGGLPGSNVLHTQQFVMVNSPSGLPDGTSGIPNIPQGIHVDFGSSIAVASGQQLAVLLRVVENLDNPGTIMNMMWGYGEQTEGNLSFGSNNPYPFGAAYGITPGGTWNFLQPTFTHPAVEPTDDIDFGALLHVSTTSEIHGTKWLDLDGDGMRDMDEPGLGGVMIYVDLNGNGQFDSGSLLGDYNQDGIIDSADYTTWRDALTAGSPDLANDATPGSVDESDFLYWRAHYGETDMGGGMGPGSEPFAITMEDDPLTPEDESGMYWITDVPTGQYFVREIVPAGYVQTYPGESPIEGGNGAHLVSIETGQVIEGIDFGNMPLASSIHGQKWNDANANGIRDPGENGLDGWEIQLFDEMGVLVATTTTMSMDLNADSEIDPYTERGLFWFDDVVPGNYQVGEVLQEGWKQTLPSLEETRQPGDANEDGVVDLSDLIQVTDWNLLNTGLPATWKQGDWTLDGFFNQDDLIALDATGLFGGDPYLDESARRIAVVVEPGAIVEGLEFANYEPIPIPDGDDEVHAGSGDDLVYGDNLILAPQYVSIGTRRDTLYGQQGDDRIFGQEEDDILWGNDDMHVEMSYGTGGDDDYLVGGEGVDEVRQTVNSLTQLLTDSLLTGQGNDDLLYIENATLRGGTAGNTIDASAFTLGWVHLYGEQANDELIGGSQDDELYGSSGVNTLRGGTGDDQYWFDHAAASMETDTVEEFAGGGTDTLNFSLLSGVGVQVDLSTGPQIAFDLGTINVRKVEVAAVGQEADLENVVGTNQGDTITGNARNNVITTLDGTDSILDAGDGSDVIDLGTGGGEFAQGGLGDDTYLLFSTSDVLLNDTDDDDTYIVSPDWGIAIISDANGDDTVDFSQLADSLSFTIGSLQVVQGANALDAPSGGLEHLIGGQNDDVFAFLDGGSLLPGGTIDGQGGEDLLDYSTYTTGVTVHLQNGDATGASTGGVSNVEHVAGGQAGDNITGDGGINILRGGPGADTIFGLGGNDTLYGNADADQLFGGDGNDLLIGGADPDTLDGQQGNDTYRVEGSIDFDNVTDTGSVFDFDTLDLSLITNGLFFDITPLLLTVYDTSSSDFLTSNGNAMELLIGGTGDDTFFFNGVGLLPPLQSAIDGGGGANTLDYSSSLASAGVNLSDVDAQVGFTTYLANTATGGTHVNNIDNIIGSANADVLIGNNDDNVLIGGDGPDFIFGRRGNDRLEGGLGSNFLYGDEGDDTYVIAQQSGSSVQLLHEDSGTASMGLATSGGKDTIDLSAIVPTSVLPLVFDLRQSAQTLDANHTLNLLLPNGNAVDIFGTSAGENFENVIGSSGVSNTLIGNKRNNILVGGFDDDVLTGNEGNDVLVGGDGEDTLDGDTGNDVLLGGDNSTPLDGDMLLGGPGRDILVGGPGTDMLDADDGEQDIVISGSTTYENVVPGSGDLIAWQQILEKWTSALSLAARQAIIDAGIGASLPGGPFLLVEGSTVFNNDGAVDSLVVNADDWLFYESGSESQLINGSGGGSGSGAVDNDLALEEFAAEPFAQQSLPFGISRPSRSPSTGRVVVSPELSQRNQLVAWRRVAGSPCRKEDTVANGPLQEEEVKDRPDRRKRSLDDILERDQQRFKLLAYDWVFDQIALNDVRVVTLGSRFSPR